MLIRPVVTWLLCRQWACPIILCGYELIRCCVWTCMRQEWVELERYFINWHDWCRLWLLPMNTLHGESWEYSTRTVQLRWIRLLFTYDRLHTASTYHVEASRKWSYVNSKYCSHCQWRSVVYFLSFIASQKEKPLLLPNLSSFGFVSRRYRKFQYLEITVEKKVRVLESEIVVRKRAM